MARRTRVKVCGITSLQQARDVSALGVDALGVVFVEKSKRFLSLESAIEIRRGLPPFVQLVALFLDAQPDQIEQVIQKVQPDLLQFHGNETVLDCERWNHPYLKAVAMGSQPDLEQIASDYAGAAGFLLDGHRRGELGGQGETFDWTCVPEMLRRPIVLAGGLCPDNVGQAIRETRPFAVDVSSGVELSPGIKDLNLVEAFVSEVCRATDCK